MVTTAMGKIEGIDRGTYTVYQGIPYAKPPVGELRWRPPVKPEPFEGVFMADHFSAKCPQHDGGMGFYDKEFYQDPEFKREHSEDCLYLNIWVPNTGKKDLPVGFFVHGGGFDHGCSSELEFDGEAFCKRDVILVTVNYRVNLFGFLAHEWFEEENEHHATGNYGLLDQIAALEWVKENIAFFGGDPNNITAFGQSAGCMSVQDLLCSSLAKGMIAKAILQSGAIYRSGFLRTAKPETAKSQGELIAQLAGVSSKEEFRRLTTKQLSDLRERYMNLMKEKKSAVPFMPSIDGYLLTQDVPTATREGKISDVPIMIGSVADDIGVTKEDKAAGRRGALYEDTVAWSLGMEAQGRKPSYVYYFSHRLPGGEPETFHSAELWYMFGTLGRCWRPMRKEDYRLSEEMVDCWSSFMKTGVPESKLSTEPWRPCSKNDPYVKEFS